MCLLLALIALFFVWRHIQFLNSIIEQQHQTMIKLNKEVETMRSQRQ
ncbi:MAG: hypothetical protein ABIJ94_00245 [candidate division WOR-3 bacterium]